MKLLPKLAMGSIFVVASAAASAAIVGPAADYGVFVFGSGNFSSQSTDSGGNLAAGGDVSLQNYSVASAIAGNPSLNPNSARLVVGGNLTATNGGVGQGQNGALYVGGAINRTSFTATGGTFGQTLVDFSAAELQYESLSLSLGGLGANGTSSISFGTLNLNGTSSTLNVFTLSAADLTSTNAVNIAAPTGSTVLINVTGNNAVFQNGNVNLTGISSAYVLYNFINATSVTLTGSKNPAGSILAPLAGVTGGFGAMDGQLITGSYGGMGGDPYGHTEFHGIAFAGTLPAPVPLPAGAWLLMSGIASLAGFARRRFRANA
ncbi:MAG: choice-of-anchor A family protein [Gammaproteobacteria bacterium]